MLLAFISLDFSFETFLWGVLALLIVYIVRQIFAPPPPPPPAPRPKPVIVLREYTKEELLRCTGTEPSTPILIGIKGKIYDVTRGRSFYGPGGPYPLFINDGHDATYALAKSSTEPSDLDKPIEELTASEQSTLTDWIGMYEGKYGCVGWLEGHPPLVQQSSPASPSPSPAPVSAQSS